MNTITIKNGKFYRNDQAIKPIFGDKEQIAIVHMYDSEDDDYGDEEMNLEDYLNENGYDWDTKEIDGQTHVIIKL